MRREEEHLLLLQIHLSPVQQIEANLLVVLAGQGHQGALVGRKGALGKVRAPLLGKASLPEGGILVKDHLVDVDQIAAQQVNALRAHIGLPIIQHQPGHRLFIVEAVPDHVVSRNTPKVAGRPGLLLRISGSRLCAAGICLPAGRLRIRRRRRLIGRCGLSRLLRPRSGVGLRGFLRSRDGIGFRRRRFASVSRFFRQGDRRQQRQQQHRQQQNRNQSLLHANPSSVQLPAAFTGPRGAIRDRSARNGQMFRSRSCSREQRPGRAKSNQ